MWVEDARVVDDDGGCHASTRFAIMLICIEDALFPALDEIYAGLLV